jgi:hypothetical protein
MSLLAKDIWSAIADCISIFPAERSWKTSKGSVQDDWNKVSREIDACANAGKGAHGDLDDSYRQRRFDISRTRTEPSAGG